MEEEKKFTSLVRSLSIAVMAIWAVVALLPIEGARAKTPVSIELVFAVDTSLSVNGFEYSLLMNGIANAFRTPEIIALIGQHEGLLHTLLPSNRRFARRIKNAEFRRQMVRFARR